MPSVKDVYASAYLSVERWTEEPRTAKISGSGVDTDNFSKDRNARIIWIQLDGQDIRIRVNKTNAEALVAAFGDDYTKWIGKTVTIHRQQQTIRGQQGWAGIITPMGSKPKKK